MRADRGEIIEIAAVQFTRQRIVDRWTSPVRPSGPLPFATQALTGLRDEDLRSAPLFAGIAPALTAFARQYPIVGQSAGLDLEMLRAAGVHLTNVVYDTFELATLLLPGLPAYSLKEIARRLDVELPGAHRALTDAEVAAAVFQRLLARLDEIDAETLGDVQRLLAAARSPLHELVRQAARDRARDAFRVGVTGAGTQTMRQRLASRAKAGDVAPEALFMTPRARPDRLEPTGKQAVIDLATLRDLFATTGPLAAVFPHYEFRPQQLLMAEAVAETFNNGGTLIVEAGTGTGKSLAYLLPAVLHAVAAGETVVVATATINLQDQLFRKDIPELQRGLARYDESRGATTSGETQRTSVPRAFTAALLKGRANYLCLRQWFAARSEHNPAPSTARVLAKTTVWLRQTETGDRAELLLLPDELPSWNLLAEHEHSCVPAQCPFQKRGQCFLYRARRDAESAHIVVINHSLLLSDLATEGGVLPPYQHLIVDEAHHLEAEATSQFGAEVDLATLTAHLDSLSKGGSGSHETGLLGTLRARLSASKARCSGEALARLGNIAPLVEGAVVTAREESVRFFERLATVVDRQGTESSGAYDRRVRLTAELRLDAGWREVEATWEALHAPLFVLADGLARLTRLLDGLGEEFEDREDLTMDVTLAERANATIRLTASAAVERPDPEMVYWIASGNGRERVGLYAAPLQVGSRLEEALYGAKRTVVLTSATLATAGSFQFINSRLGLEAPRELLVSSPFDYANNVLLYLTDDVPEPASPGYQKTVNEAIVAACRATEGRALVLFTSHSALQATYRAVKDPLERLGILVLGQRIDGNPRQVLDRFRSNPRAVILGTSSFWEGVDIVGEALSLLVMTKLPFAVPTDPIFAARSELVDNPFSDFAVPNAILRFKQGFGRLIRGEQDRGICAILDRRIVTKRYGRAFIDSLPPCTVQRGPVADLGPSAAAWLATTRTATSR